MQKVKALLFDLGGVIIDINWRRVFSIWSEYSGIAAEEIAARYSFDAAYRAHERGEISWQKYFASLRISLAIDLSDQQFLEGWNAIFNHEIPGFEGLLENIDPNIPRFVFSNSNQIHTEFWLHRYRKILAGFEKVYISSQIGLRKPDAQAFEFVAKDMNTPLQNILFFDDTLENVTGARVARMPAVHVQRNQDIETALVEFNLRTKRLSNLRDKTCEQKD